MAIKLPSAKILKHLAAVAGLIIILLMFAALIAEVIKNVIELI